jgi:hypothetical protein
LLLGQTGRYVALPAHRRDCCADSVPWGYQEGSALDGEYLRKAKKLDQKFNDVEVDKVGQSRSTSKWGLMAVPELNQ